MIEFSLESWCDDVENTAASIIDPELQNKDRRKFERQLTALTTPYFCLAVSRDVRKLMCDLEKANNRIKEFSSNVLYAEKSS